MAAVHFFVLSQYSSVVISLLYEASGSTTDAGLSVQTESFQESFCLNVNLGVKLHDLSLYA